LLAARGGIARAVAASMTEAKWYAPSPFMPAPIGPFRPSHVKEGDRYEISRGHPVHVAPAGGRHGKEHVVGSLPLATDPAVTEVGIDVGYELNEYTLRAPDIAVGNVPNAPGWVKGAPTLAVEYADRGTDEDDLQTKIAELLEAGTKVVWVVRLVGPRRVDVHLSGEQPRVVPSGGVLEAPGILARSVPVDALFDEERAREIAFSNMLAKEGHSSLDEMLAREREHGHRSAVRVVIETMCSAMGIVLDESRLREVESLDDGGLKALIAHLAAHRAWP